MGLENKKFGPEKMARLHKERAMREADILRGEYGADKDGSARLTITDRGISQTEKDVEGEITYHGAGKGE